MSRFSNLSKHLPLHKALNLYAKMKLGQFNNWKVSKLKHPFSLRNNPYDYATFEEVILQESYKLPGDLKPATIIDAGANIGLTSAYFASRFPGAAIVSLEPEMENFDLLKANTHAYPNMHPLLGGLWCEDAWLSIIHTGEGNNAFRVTTSQQQTKGAVKAWSVAGIMEEQQWSRLDLLKMDIEGAEKEVFEKNTGWIPRVKMMIIEFHDRFKPGCEAAVRDAIKQYNFSSYTQGENQVFINNDLADHHSSANR